MVDPAPDTVSRTPRWALAAAYAVPVCILPSAVWRAVGVLDGRLTEDGGATWYPLLLSGVSLGLGLPTLGLVHAWGERIPRWVPGLGGRRVPIAAAVIPAVAGALALLALIAGFVDANLVRPIDRIDPDVVLIGEAPTDMRPLHQRDPAMFTEVLWTYTPMVAWPVLLLAVTWAYYRRRTR